MTLYAEEHDELRASVRGLLQKSADSAQVRATIASGGHDAALWKRMSDELGLTGLAIPEERGGAGFGIVELAVVLEEIGRVNLPSPFLTTVLAGLALDGAGSEAETAIARGERRATVALAGWSGGTATSPDQPAAVDEITAGTPQAEPRRRDRVTVTRSHESGSGWTRTLRHVPDGDTADLLVLVGDQQVAIVDLTDDRVRRTPLETMDLTRGQAHLALDAVPVRSVPAPAGHADRIAALAAVLVACEQFGGAERVLELSSAYAKERVQFGRPVGSFQAVKHLLADMLIELELARSAQRHAVALAGDPATPATTLDAAARTARVACSRAFVRLTSDAIRVHGGIGYTWEHDLHLYFRRARASAVLFGREADDADALATHAGLRPGEERT